MAIKNNYVLNLVPDFGHVHLNFNVTNMSVLCGLIQCASF